MRNRQHIHLPTNILDHATDHITAFSGSWLFLSLHVLWFTLWISLHIEPFPFGLLTMIVSLEAIFLSTLVMMSQNRQSDKDRKRDDLEATEVSEIYHINQRQLEILEILHELQGKQEAKA